jgi:hypothetical protein
VRTTQKLLLGMLLCAFVGAALFAPPVQAQTAQTGSNWTAFFWNNRNFEGNPVVGRTDQVVNFNWQTGSPAAGVNGDNFSARWSTTINFAAGTYRFRAGADDGVRVAIDGVLIINMWTDAVNGFQVSTADVQLSAGNHTIVIDYYENVGNAGVLFDYSGAPPPGQPSVPNGGGNAIPTNPPQPPSMAPNEVKVQVIVNVGYVRAAPTLDSNLVAEIYRNSRYVAVARDGNNGNRTWFLIDLGDGRRGWIPRLSIYPFTGSVALLPVSAETFNVPPVNVQGVAARQEVVVRDGPTARNSQRIGVLPAGTYFQVLKISRNRAWLLIDASGLQGWVYLPDIDLVQGNLAHLPQTRQ